MSQGDGARRGYVAVNGLNMYYEVEGSGPPLLLLHGGLTTIDYSFGKVRADLAQRWTTIAVEQQAHGRTADIPRNVTYADMADDTAATMRQLGFENADVFGWSDGGNVGFQLALRHPALVRKLATFGSFCAMDGLYPEIVKFFETATANDFDAELRETHIKVSGRADAWNQLFERTKTMNFPPEHWGSQNLGNIAAPVLFMIGDADILKPEHAVEVFRLLRHGQLAILPGTNHFAPVTKPALIYPTVEAFLKAPMPKAKSGPKFG